MHPSTPASSDSEGRNRAVEDDRTGLSRHVWHLPLFFLGLVVLFGSLIGAVFFP